MDMKTQNKRKTMIELILDKKSIQIDEEFLDIKKHLEKFYSNKEQDPIAQTLECAYHAVISLDISPLSIA